MRYTPSPLRRTASSIVCAALVASAVVVRSSDAHASAPGYTLEWEASGACPSTDEVREAIDALLIDAAVPDQPPVAARGRIEGTERGHRLVLEIGGRPREIEGPDCTELSRTAALIVAMAVDPRVLAQVDRHPHKEPVAPDPPPLVVPPVEMPVPPPTPEHGTPARPGDPNPNPNPNPNPVAPREDAARPARVLGVAGAIAAGLDVGTLPAPAAHVAVSLSGFTRRLRIDVVGDYVARRGIDSPEVDEIGIDVQAWSVGVRGCGLWHVRRASLAACVSARGGLVHARGRGVGLQPESARQPWAGIGPAGLVIVPLSPRIGLLAGLDVLVAATRGGFRTDPSGRVAQTWPVTPSLWVGIQWRSLTGPRDGGQPRR